MKENNLIITNIYSGDLKSKSLETLIEICIKQTLEIEKLNEKILTLQSSNKDSQELGLNKLFSRFTIEKLRETEERELFEFSELAKELINDVQSVFAWFSPIADYLISPELLSEKQNKILESQIEKIKTNI